jgi:hypothetical protein
MVRSATAALFTALALTLAWKELPAIRRYLKIERM